MKLIISPAKKMKVDTDSLPWRDLPRFLEQSEELHSALRSMSYDQLKALWKCNDQIAQLNFDRLQTMDLRRNLTPVLLAYEGIQYRYMAPGVFSDREFEYAQDHLRILSGFYGLLRPFDGVVPYRLEMGAKLPMGSHKDLYAYWGSRLADALCSEDDTILNLASKEYSQCIAKHLSTGTRMITCIFGELQPSGKIIEKGTLCKMARGEMVGFLAENNIDSPEEAKAFDQLNYRYSEEHSDNNNYTFILQK